MKALFQTAVRWTKLKVNPFVGVKQLKVPPRRPTFFTKEEFAQLLQAVPRQWSKEIVIFAVSTMMRAGEIVKLSWRSIDLNRKIIMVENTDQHRLKTPQPHAVPMNDWVYKFLATRKNKTGNVFRFPDGRNLNVHYVSQTFKKFVKAAGLPDDLHFHTLRHTGASWLVQDGVSIYAVQRLLGLSNINVTMMYSHLVTSEMHGAINQIQFPTN